MRVDWRKRIKSKAVGACIHQIDDRKNIKQNLIKRRAGTGEKFHSQFSLICEHGIPMAEQGFIN